MIEKIIVAVLIKKVTLNDHVDIFSLEQMSLKSYHQALK